LKDIEDGQTPTTARMVAKGREMAARRKPRRGGAEKNVNLIVSFRSDSPFRTGDKAQSDGKRGEKERSERGKAASYSARKGKRGTPGKYIYRDQPNGKVMKISKNKIMLVGKVGKRRYDWGEGKKGGKDAQREEGNEEKRSGANAPRPHDSEGTT